MQIIIGLVTIFVLCIGLLLFKHLKENTGPPPKALRDVFGFVIGPRLNAAGRMDSPYKAVNLILNNGETLEKTLHEIENLNEQRKFQTKMFVEEALQKVNMKDNLLFYYSPAIEHGIIGIVAGRLTEQFYRPSIVLKDE